MDAGLPQRLRLVPRASGEGLASRATKQRALRGGAAAAASAPQGSFIWAESPPPLRYDRCVLIRLMGRPCRALGDIGGDLTQSLVALVGLRTLGSGRIAPLGLACPFVGSPSGHLHLDLPRQAGACVAVRRQSVWRALLACRISLFASLPCACLSFIALSPYRGDPIQSPGCVALQGRPNPGLFG